jgi:hypothetical protein
MDLAGRVRQDGRAGKAGEGKAASVRIDRPPMSKPSTGPLTKYNGCGLPAGAATLIGAISAAAPGEGDRPLTK